MKKRVWPYRQGSRGAAALAAMMQGRVLKRAGSTYVPAPADLIVNWGDPDIPQSLRGRGGFNTDCDLRTASNKLKFFKHLTEKGCSDILPRFWETKDEIPDDAFPIVCRTVLAGHSGDGIVIAGDRDALVVAPLYVEYKKKKDEYRVHVGFRHDEFRVIATQRKARRRDVPDEDVDWQVRNHSNGFVFVRKNVVPNSLVTEAATKGLEATGLDFGAVDVIWNEHEQKAYVLEINTAPGLEGQTVNDYANFFTGQSQDSEAPPQS